MPQKAWVAHHDGREIRVVNTWTGGTRLYVDGECRDRNHGLWAPRWTWWLSSRLDRDDPSSPLVEVYVAALVRVRAEIRIDGVVVGGDRRR
jgi:hypothetical protein